MNPIRTAGLAGALVLSSLAIVAAQQVSEGSSKVTVKDGKDIQVTGCIAAAPPGAEPGYLLTNVADKKGTLPDYTLIGKDNDELQKHLGHRVEVSGLAADKNGKVEIETKTKTKVEHGHDQESHSKSTLTGDMPGMTYLKVKSLKMIAAVCP